MSSVVIRSFSPAITNESGLEIAPSTLTYVWTIDDFDSVEAKGETVISSPITTEGCSTTWGMRLKPNGENSTRNTISLLLFLHHESKKNQTYANCDAHIVNKEERKMPSKSIRAWEFNASTGRISAFGWADFLCKDEHFRTNLLSNNKLSIYFKLEFSQQQEIIGYGCRKTLVYLTSYTSECDLIDNFASLLETQAFSDIVLSTNGKDFPAHKAILATRSKVFAAMFQQDLKEVQQNRIIIEDASEETVEEMLRFIYTGKCNKLDQLAEELLAVADKYDLDRLKLLCGESLSRTLSPANASNTLILADTYNAKELKSDAIEFIVGRASEVLNTAAWRNLRSKDQLVDEVMECMALRLSSQHVNEIEF